MLSEESEDQYEQNIDNFKKGFSAPALQRQSTVGLVTNFNLIYMILISITDVFIRNLEESKKDGYFEINSADIEKEVEVVSETEVSPLEF